MGGKALRQTDTRRYAADEYHAFSEQVVSTLQSLLPDARLQAVRAYRDKPDFGDLDVVVENLDAKNRLEPLLVSLGITEVVKNGPVWSVGWGDFQVDLIFQASENWEFACNYFAYNDLGNLCGRIAYNMGFKFGHNGLRYVLRDGDYKVAELVLTKDHTEALTFLGYDPSRYAQGFDTLEDIFQYAMATEYYDPAYFALENRPYRERIRDAKRPTYNAFLEYVNRDGNNVARDNPLDKDEQLTRAKITFPAFGAALARTMENHDRHKLVKVKFNGSVVSRVTGLEGKDLGGFMQLLREDAETNHGGLDNWVLVSDVPALESWIKRQLAVHQPAS